MNSQELEAQRIMYQELLPQLRKATGTSLRSIYVRAETRDGIDYFYLRNKSGFRYCDPMKIEDFNAFLQRKIKEGEPLKSESKHPRPVKRVAVRQDERGAFDILNNIAADLLGGK